MAQLIVGLTPALARALARGDRTRDTTRLRDLDLTPHRARSLDSEEIEEIGDVEEIEGVVWFSAETDDPEDLGPRLLRIPGVTAAYATPPQGPP